jgi:hypothetical protein
MRFFLLSLLFLFFENSLFSSQFTLKGWEYETKLSHQGHPITADDIYFLKTAVLNGKIFLFYKNHDSLMALQFENNKVAAVREIQKIDKFTLPVIKANSNILSILFYLNGYYQLMMGESGQLDKMRTIYSFPYPMNYNSDLFVQNHDIVISLPVIINEKPAIKIKALEKKQGNYTSRDWDISAPDERDKGIFFFRMFKENDKYFSYFIKRFYDSSLKQIRDSLCYFQTSDFSQIKNAKPNLLIPFGWSDHPPDILSYQGNITILISRKRDSAYLLRLLSDKNKIEYPISQEYINAYSPVYLFENGILDLFYLGNLGGKSQIYHRKIDLNRIDQIDSLSSDFSNIAATKPDNNVYALSLCKKGSESYIFYICSNDGAIYYSKTDRSVQGLQIEKELKIENNEEYYDFAWKIPDDPSGISGYSYIIDDKPDTLPVIVNLSAQERFVSTKHLKKEGDYFLHIKVIDGIGNSGPVEHIVFSTGKVSEKTIFARINESTSQSKINKAIEFINSELSLSNDYEKGSYLALLNYYKEVEKNIMEKNYSLARKNLNRCILIDPFRMETALYLQLIKKEEENPFYKYQMLLNIFLFLALILLLSLLYGVFAKL